MYFSPKTAHLSIPRRTYVEWVGLGLLRMTCDMWIFVGHHEQRTSLDLVVSVVVVVLLLVEHVQPVLPNELGHDLEAKGREQHDDEREGDGDLLDGLDDVEHDETQQLKTREAEYMEDWHSADEVGGRIQRWLDEE